jgi:hypothetical protein
VIAGIAVNADNQFKEVESYLDSLLHTHVSEPDGIVFHAMELWHGTKQFHRDHWPLEKRLEILDDLAHVPRKFGLPIFYGSTNRLEIRSTLPPLMGTPIRQNMLEGAVHAHSFLHFIAQLETFMRANYPNEVEMLIAEDRPEVRNTVKFTHGVFRGRGLKQDQSSFEAIKNKLLGELMPLDAEAGIQPFTSCRPMRVCNKAEYAEGPALGKTLHSLTRTGHFSSRCCPGRR